MIELLRESRARKSFVRGRYVESPWARPRMHAKHSLPRNHYFTCILRQYHHQLLPWTQPGILHHPHPLCSKTLLFQTQQTLV